MNLHQPGSYSEQSGINNRFMAMMSRTRTYKRQNMQSRFKENLILFAVMLLITLWVAVIQLMK